MKQNRIYLPIIIAVAIVVGMIIGHYFTPSNTVAENRYGSQTKINAILSLIATSYVDSVDIDKIQEDAIPLILEELDPHSSYIKAKEMTEVSEEMTGNFGGIGVQFSIQKDTVQIIDVISGGPSQKLGLLPGDRITMVDDSLIAGVNVSNETVMNLLRGKKGTKVKVGVTRSGINDIIWFEITRGEIPLYSVDVNYMINDTTGYIKVSRFAEKTHQEFVEACINVVNQGATRFVIDLRSNPGGYLSAVINMVNEFLPKDAMIVYTKGRSRDQMESKSNGKGLFQDKKVIVLIDEYSASASEIFAGALQDNDRAVIVGRRSFGKGLVQEQIPFTDGSALRLTVSRYYIPSGRCIQKPYTDGTNEYYHDIINRIEHGELSQSDSIQFADSLKYETLNGRTVYGGGGVMPDCFVPIDTTKYSTYFTKLVLKGLIYKFAIEYSDKNRVALNEIKNSNDMYSYLSREQNVLNKFVNYAEKEGVAKSTKGIEVSGKIIETQIIAYITRNILGDVGFYPIIHKIDDAMDKAKEIYEDNSLYKSYLDSK